MTTQSAATIAATEAAAACITPIQVNQATLDLQPIMDVLPAGELYRLFTLFTEGGCKTIGDAVNMIEEGKIGERDLLLMTTVVEMGMRMPLAIRYVAVDTLGIALA